MSFDQRVKQSFILVIIIDGNSEHVAHVWRKTYLVEEKNAVDLKKLLIQIRLPIFLYTCAPISNKPSHIGTMYIDTVQCCFYTWISTLSLLFITCLTSSDIFILSRITFLKFKRIFNVFWAKSSDSNNNEWNFT